MAEAWDIVVIGAGPSGAAAAARLAEETRASICVLEAGEPADSWRARLPAWQGDAEHGLDWGRSAPPQDLLGGRRPALPSGRGVGGSELLAPPLWMRAAPEDFDAWNLPGWDWGALGPSWAEVERRLAPRPPARPEPVSAALAGTEGVPAAPPEPAHTGFGLLPGTAPRGARRTTWDALAAPLADRGRIELLTGRRVARVLFRQWRAVAVELTDGRRITARGGVILCAGALETPTILMRSGIGPSGRIGALGLPVAVHVGGVGEHLCVRPLIRLVHDGGGRGGDWKNAARWLVAAAGWTGAEKGGPLGRCLYEAGGFLRAGHGAGPTDIEARLRLARPDWPVKDRFAPPGLTLEARICRPVSRGRVSLAGADPRLAPRVDPGLLSRDADRALMRVALRRLRAIIDREEFEGLVGPEAAPGRKVEDESALDALVRRTVISGGEMAGTCAMGAREESPLDPQMRVRGVDGLWVCDTSAFPALPSAGTRAAAAAAGWHGGGMIARALATDIRDVA
ncbi:GMC family oxidoreductase [Rhodovulum sp. DZ06]|uniref:GMC family oxidoreductase n=1 Tax=Rhodovulum sp. DZ06 TaxID=3425126 RepID=UPI003D34F646